MALPGGLPEGPEATEPAPRRRRDLRLIGTGVLLGLGAWFALVNTQDVKIRFWLVTTRTPVVSALVIAFVLGVGLGALVVRRFRRHAD
jgi:uncharacterized integral membrane protein